MTYYWVKKIVKARVICWENSTRKSCLNLLYCERLISWPLHIVGGNLSCSTLILGKKAGNICGCKICETENVLRKLWINGQKPSTIILRWNWRQKATRKHWAWSAMAGQAVVKRVGGISQSGLVLSNLFTGGLFHDLVFTFTLCFHLS